MWGVARADRQVDCPSGISIIAQHSSNNNNNKNCDYNKCSNWSARAEARPTYDVVVPLTLTEFLCHCVSVNLRVEDAKLVRNYGKLRGKCNNANGWGGGRQTL